MGSLDMACFLVKAKSFMNLWTRIWSPEEGLQSGVPGINLASDKAEVFFQMHRGGGVQSVIVGQSYWGSLVVHSILRGIPRSFLVSCKAAETVGPSKKPRDGGEV